MKENVTQDHISYMLPVLKYLTVSIRALVMNIDC